MIAKYAFVRSAGEYFQSNRRKSHQSSGVIVTVDPMKAINGFKMRRMKVTRWFQEGSEVYSRKLTGET